MAEGNTTKRSTESHHVRLTFNQPLSDEDLRTLQLRTDALEATRLQPHHDHDHPSAEF